MKDLKYKQICIEQLKVIQLEILDNIHKYCTENNIKYSLACGTLLGAARHKGYIPWDDDIDIYIPRKDYNKLISNFPNPYNKKYHIVSLENDSNWDRPYAKAYDNSTILIEPGSKYKIGINIDIYPIDSVPDNKIDWYKYNRLRKIIQYSYALKSVKITLKRNLIKNILIIINRIITYPLSKRNFAKLIQKYAQKNNGKGFSNCFECVQGLFQKEPFSADLFNELEYMHFENREYLAFKKYKSYLSAGYGDWEKLPPMEKRVSHHVFRAYYK